MIFHYKKGMSLGWRLSLILGLFATIPRIIFVWNPVFSTGLLKNALLDIGGQFILSTFFAWIYVYICLNYTYQTPNWFNKQKTWLQIVLLVEVFFILNEVFIQIKILTGSTNTDLILFRVVYYAYHFMVVLAIQAFGYVLVALQKNYQITFENEQLKRDRLKTQLEALRNQLNPHFLFNALNILNISIVTNPDMAQRIVHDLSDILRYNLKVQNQNLVLLADELAAARSYLDLYKVRFGDKLVFYFNNVDTTKEWFIIPLSLQLLIENAIKHNVITSNQVLHIEVKLSETGKELIVINSVNKKVSLTSTGIGLQNLDKRYKIQTGLKTSLVEDEKQFIVKVPLIQSP